MLTRSRTIALAVLSPPAPGPMRVISPACSVENVSAFRVSGTHVGSAVGTGSGATEAEDSSILPMSLTLAFDALACLSFCDVTLVIPVMSRFRRLYRFSEPSLRLLRSSRRYQILRRHL